MSEPILREEEQLRRKTDIYYTCLICGRENKSYNTLLKDNKPECIYACFPKINSIIGCLLNLMDRRTV